MKRIVIIFLLSAIVKMAHAQVDLTVTIDEQLKGRYSGRLFVYTLKDTSRQFTDRSMAEEPAFSRDVSNWHAGKVISFNADVTASHIPLDSLIAGTYKLVAILDTNTSERGNSAPGNLYSRNEGLLEIKSKGKGKGSVRLNSVFQERVFRESAMVKEVRLRSALLSRFRKKDIFLRAAVILPESYKTDTARRYPVVFIIPGWGGTHHNGGNPGMQKQYGMKEGKEKIYIYLNPENQTPWGLHAFVDSRVNGPWGKALVNELIPYLENQYRISLAPKERFLTGQSSGGYGAVWLALNYPEHFGGCWATAPDPLDFSSFIGVDIYHDRNFYTDVSEGERRINLVNGVFQQTLKQMAISEQFAGDGGQLQSFEAEFGLPGKDGRPKPLFDRKSGIIDHAVADEWQPYDLSRLIKRKRGRIKMAGVGKITVYAGAADNFLLNKPAEKFGEAARKVNDSIKVIILPGTDHFSVRNTQLSTEINKEMDRLIDYQNNSNEK